METNEPPFKGLFMSDLIGAPLIAASNALVKLSNATADFIKIIGFLPPTTTRLADDYEAADTDTN